MTTLEIEAIEKYRVEMIDKINSINARHRDQKVVSVEVMWQLFHAIVESSFSNQFIGGREYDAIGSNMSAVGNKEEVDERFMRFVPKEKVVGMPCP